MCGRYAMGMDSQSLSLCLDSLGIDTTALACTYTPRYNLGPTHVAPLVVPVGDQLTLTPMAWGLLPPWTEVGDTQQPWKTFNARLESIQEGIRTWKQPRNEARCVIPLQGYYEWVERRSSGKTVEKIPYYVSRKDGRVMLAAGMYQPRLAQDPASERGTFTMVTGPAVDSLRWLHHRTPVFLDPDGVALWALTRPWDATVSLVLRPYASDDVFQWWRVAPAVGKLGPDGVRMIEPVKEAPTNIFSMLRFSPEEPKVASLFVESDEEVEVKNPRLLPAREKVKKKAAPKVVKAKRVKKVVIAKGQRSIFDMISPVKTEEALTMRHVVLKSEELRSPIEGSPQKVKLEPRIGVKSESQPGLPKE